MKIASGSVDLGKAYSGLFVFHLSVFPDDSNLERGSFFSEEYCFKAFQHRRLFFLTFFSSTHDIFENKYFRGITMVLSRVVPDKLMVRKVKTHFKMHDSFSVIGNCYSSYNMQPWLPHRIKTMITYIFTYSQPSVELQTFV